jgi:hypothetical protein
MHGDDLGEPAKADPQVDADPLRRDDVADGIEARVDVGFKAGAEAQVREAPQLPDILWR